MKPGRFFQENVFRYTLGEPMIQSAMGSRSTLFGVGQGSEEDAEQKHGGGNADPAVSHVVERETLAERGERAERDAGSIERVDDADDAGASNSERIGEAVSRPETVAQTEQNEHDGDRIDRVQYGDRDAEDGAKTLIADEKREAGDDQNPCPIGDFFEQDGEILRDGVDQADTGGQAGEREDGGEQDGARRAEKLIDDTAQRPCAVLLDGVDAGGAHPHIGEHGGRRMAARILAEKGREKRDRTADLMTASCDRFVIFSVFASNTSVPSAKSAEFCRVLPIVSTRFRAHLGHNLGQGWQVNLEDFCRG